MYTQVTLHAPVAAALAGPQAHRLTERVESAATIAARYGYEHPLKYSERLAKQLRLPRLLPFQTATWTEL